MKTVSQIASENNISTQAVYKRMKRLATRLQTHIHKGEDGKTLIDQDGEGILLEGLQPITNHVTNHVTNQFTTFLQDQIKVKDQQIADLMGQNKDLIQKIEYFQVLLKNEQDIKTLPPSIDHQEQTKDKKTMLQKIKNLFKASADHEDHPHT